MKPWKGNDICVGQFHVNTILLFRFHFYVPPLPNAGQSPLLGALSSARWGGSLRVCAIVLRSGNRSKMNACTNDWLLLPAGDLPMVRVKNVGSQKNPTHVELWKSTINNHKSNHNRIVDPTKHWYYLPWRNSNSGVPKTEGKIHGSDSPQVEDKHAIYE